MKSLYSILGISPDSSAQQIETAYVEALEQCQSGKFSSDHADTHIRLVAIKEAYATLSDPVARKQYNHRLFANDATDTQIVYVSEAEEGFWNFKKIALVVLILVIGGAYYQHNLTERMRLQHEREVAAKALQLLEEQERRKAAESEAQLVRQQQIDNQAQDRRLRAEDERFRQQADQQARMAVYNQQAQAAREEQERVRQQRQAQYEAQRQVERDKMTLQRMERENYGRVITR